MTPTNGFDAEFVEPLLDEFQCIICHLALREPVQLSVCGHRFCHACFLTMEKHYKLINQPVLCPLDQSFVELKKVFLDKGIERQILGLQVKCSNQMLGCSWTGDLRQLEEHLLDCSMKIEDEEENKTSSQDDKLLFDKDHLKKISEKVEENDSNIRKFYQEFIATNVEQTQIMAKYDQKLDSVVSTVSKLQNNYKKLSESFKTQKEELQSKELKWKLLEETFNTEKTKTADSLKEFHTVISNLRKSIDSQIKGVKAEIKILEVSTEKRAWSKAYTTTKPDTNVSIKSEKIGSSSSSLVDCKVDLSKVGAKLKNVKDTPETPLEVLTEVAKGIDDIDQRLEVLEMNNPFSGFFAWTVRSFSLFKTNGSVVERKEVKTSLYGFECELSLRWQEHRKRESVVLDFKVLRQTPHTVPYLPFFCDLIIAVVAADGEVMSRRISYTNLDFSRRNAERCSAEIKGFLAFPKHKKFIVDDKLRMFGYFKPFDPVV